MAPSVTVSLRQVAALHRRRSKIIIHDMNEKHSSQEWIYRTRWVEPRLARATKDHPVVVVTGARQVGKSTLLLHAPIEPQQVML